MFARTLKSFIKVVAFLVLVMGFIFTTGRSIAAPVQAPVAQAGATQLKICKALERGTQAPRGTVFFFDVQRLNDMSAPFVVGGIAPGSCFAFEVAPGQFRITERPQSPDNFQVDNIVFKSGTGSKNIPLQRATATVVRGQTTEVVFVNEFVNSVLKICKDLAAGTTVAPGTLFRFRITGTYDRLISPDTCVEVRVAAGTVNVREIIPTVFDPVTGQRVPLFEVTSIRFLAGTGGTPDLANASVTSNQVANQTTIVEFTNRGFGYIQICKETRVTDRSDPAFQETGSFLFGDFDFTSPSFAGTRRITVVQDAAQPVCGDLIRVPAGRTVITELPANGTNGFPTFLAGTRTVPVGAKVQVGSDEHRRNRQLVFNVPASGPEDQVLAIFRNAQEAFIEICKETRGGLTGNFDFTLRALDNTVYNREALRTFRITITSGADQPVCTRPIRVIARDTTITETGPGFLRSSADVFVRQGGSARVRSVNTGTKTAVVRVFPGTVENDSLIIFRNYATVSGD